jgi:hypothetical protein
MKKEMYYNNLIKHIKKYEDNFDSMNMYILKLLKNFFLKILGKALKRRNIENGK